MKVVVFGATGPTGREVVTQALDAGHAVRAFARNPAAVGAWAPGLEVVQGDVLDPNAVRAAVGGMDAVLSALGTGWNLEPTTVLSEGTGLILDAMTSLGVKRILCVTSAGLLDDPNAPFVFRVFIRRRLRHVHEDLRRLEERLRASDREWTIVRPPRLLDGPRTGRYRIEVDKPVRHGHQINRTDVADFMLRELGARQFVGRAVTIAY
ncbi:NAD(P)-dependent oxidoreductase [Polyangium aurulentum]|uniref:NAD(P)-dependent oxidoreductase n=1 Tax=Polyangium aurulentum TaxID=2567896 RepID=UPI00146E6391|nr:SDR family oxidoreductase [Polyangium aurulentum]UQA59644.1 SDR family oxidoreductase [Polyangium aurulentum]